MDWVGILTTLGTMLPALGVVELVKWWANRRNNSRIAESQADISETQAASDEFHLLRERLELSDRQLLDKEQRFHEQTQLVRELNKQLLDKAVENGQLNARIGALEAERALKLCERRGCKDRQPQSGY